MDAALSEVLGRQVRLTSDVPAGGRFEEQWPDIDGLAPQDFIDRTTSAHEGSEPVSSLLTTSTLDHLKGLRHAVVLREAVGGSAHQHVRPVAAHVERQSRLEPGRAAVTTPGTVRVGDEVTVQGLPGPTTTC